MPIEIRGKHLRIRVKNLKDFQVGSFRTHDVGAKGKLKRIAGKLKKTGKWRTQSWLLHLPSYKTRQEALRDLNSIRTLTPAQRTKAIKYLFAKSKFKRN